MKICLVCSYGGHLYELLKIKAAWDGHTAFLITYAEGYEMELDGIPKVYRLSDFHSRSTAKLLLFLNMVTVTIKELVILVRERPDMIISTGAEIAIPICYMAKLLRKKIIFIESVCRVYKPSVSARIIYPIADLFMVQWEPLLKKFRKARYAGKVI